MCSVTFKLWLKIDFKPVLIIVKLCEFNTSFNWRAILLKAIFLNWNLKTLKSKCFAQHLDEVKFTKHSWAENFCIGNPLYRYPLWTLSIFCLILYIFWYSSWFPTNNLSVSDWLFGFCNLQINKKSISSIDLDIHNSQVFSCD